MLLAQQETFLIGNTPITFRHPSVLVKMASTINDMAPNRFRLGVGTGWLEIEHELFGIPFPDLKRDSKC